MFTFTDTSGHVTTYDNSDAAMKAYADAGFIGILTGPPKGGDEPLSTATLHPAAPLDNTRYGVSAPVATPSAVAVATVSSPLPVSPVYMAALIGYVDDEADYTVGDVSFYHRDDTYISEVYDWQATQDAPVAQATCNVSKAVLANINPLSALTITRSTLAYDVKNQPVVAVVAGGAASRVEKDGGNVADRLTPSGHVSVVAQARNRADDTLLSSIGLARPSGNYATNPGMRTAGGYEVGASVIDLGYENLRTAYRTWEEMPMVEDGAEQVRDAIRAERRFDLSVNVRDLTVDGMGRFVLPNVGPVDLEPRAYAALLARVQGDVPAAVYAKAAGQLDVDVTIPNGQMFVGAARYLLSLPPEERAEHVARGLLRADPGVAVLRMRHVDNKPQVFAVVSEHYAAFDGDEVLDAIAKTFGGKGYRGEVGYDSGSTALTVDAKYHASRIVDFSAGDITSIGPRFRSNDAGGGSINGAAGATWNGCLNYIVIEDGVGATFRVVHKGNVGAVVSSLSAHMKAMQPVFEVFGKRWGLLRSKPIRAERMFGKPVRTGRDVLAALVSDGKLDIGLTPQARTDALHQAWEAEGPLHQGDDSYARVIAAITRMAHERLLDDCSRDAAERRAGALVPVLAGYAEA